MNYIELDNSYKKNKLKNLNNQESKLYTYENYLYKKIHNYLLTKERIQTIDELSILNNPSYVTPKKIVIYKNKINGYLMNYYKEYKQITQYILNKNITLEERKNISKKICMLIKELENIDILYTDIHSDNILIKDNDIKLIDMDSVLMPWNNKDIEIRNKIKIYIQNYLADLSLQIMTGSENIYRRKVTKQQKNKILSICNNNQKEFIEHSFETNYNNFNAIDYIDEFDNQTINNIRLELRLK